MLPNCRKEGDIFSIPKFDLRAGDVESFFDELQTFQGEFAHCFQRSETRENFGRYMTGQFAELERKSIEPIALAVQDGAVRAMQRAISDAVWDEAEIYDKYRSLAGEDLSDPNAALIFDESSFQKKGEDSVGVARQYCGSLGKVENCQVGVYAAYASPHGYALVGTRLFLPEVWFDDEHAEKREKCRVPEDLQFKTKPQLAAEMLEELNRCAALPFKYILADSIYGQSPEFIAAAERCTGKTYFVAVSKETRVWLQRPLTRTKQYRYAGELRSKEVLSDQAKKPLTVEEVATNLSPYYWYRRTVSEGTKGPIVYEFARRRVILAEQGLPGGEVWLVVRRTLGESPIYSFFISNANHSAPLSLFVWLSGLRWAIEQCFEECKTDLGLDHYEVRKYAGWHHHMLTCMLAHFFLWHMKIRLGKKSTGGYALSA